MEDREIEHDLMYLHHGISMPKHKSIKHEDDFDLQDLLAGLPGTEVESDDELLGLQPTSGTCHGQAIVDGIYKPPLAEALHRMSLLSSEDTIRFFRDHARQPANIPSLYSDPTRRVEILAHHFAANELNTIAPVFRLKAWQGLMVKTHDPSQSQGLGDKQLVDIHWLLCRRLEDGQGNLTVTGYDDTYDLLVDNAIKWSETIRFVRVSRKAEGKADDLDASIRERLLLSMLHDDAQRKWKKRITDKHPETIRMIQNTISNPRTRAPNGSAQELAERWLVFRFANRSPNLAAELEPYITGISHTDEQSRSRAIDRFKGLQRAAWTKGLSG